MSSMRHYLYYNSHIIVSSYYFLQYSLQPGRNSQQRDISSRESKNYLTLPYLRGGQALTPAQR